MRFVAISGSAFILLIVWSVLIVAPVNACELGAPNCFRPMMNSAVDTAEHPFSNVGPSQFESGPFVLPNLRPAIEDDDAQISQAGTRKPGITQGNSVSQGGYTQEQINEMINNPLGELWMLSAQNDIVWYGGNILDRLGEDNKIMNTTVIQPVLAMQLTPKWKVILRPTIPINSFDVPDGISVIRNEEEKPVGLNVEFARKTGLGDIALATAFATNDWAKPPNIFGFGPTIILDTATNDALGTGKFSAGPMAAAVHIGDDWIYGTIAQHWWSFAGDGDRSDVNLTDIQYLLRYRLTSETSIGMGPNIRVNWEADNGDRLTLPIGLGVETTIKIGPAPVKFGLEFQYFAEQPDPVGPKFQLRFTMSPVIPSPAWSKRPLL